MDVDVTRDIRRTEVVMWWRIAGIVGALGVMFGAFGAHGLKDHVSPELLEVWQTGARYHQIHAVALLALATMREPPKVTGWLFVAGIALFSGSLYVMTLTGYHWLGAITPLGGLCFIAGWTALVVRPPRNTLSA